VVIGISIRTRDRRIGSIREEDRPNMLFGIQTLQSSPGIVAQRAAPPPQKQKMVSSNPMRGSKFFGEEHRNAVVVYIICIGLIGIV
jgi:hypothetical protein